MRILVEASSAFDQYAGIGRYARNVLGNMVELAATGDSFRLVRTRDQADLDLGDFERITRGIPVRVIPLSRQNAYRVWFRLNLPIDIQWIAGRSDVAYSPDFTMWHTSGIPRMVTVHDLAHLTNPEYTVPGLLKFLNRVVEAQIERSTKIAVVSRATGSDMTKLMGVPADRLVYAPNAVDSRFFAPEPLNKEERESLGLPAEFCLMVSTIEPRKNHINAVRAHEQSEAAIGLPLVIVGRYGWGLDQILPVIEEAEAKGTVRYMSFVDDALLPRLMASAHTLIYPSWNEGFGLPVAEMLAVGGNVVISRAPALIEVAGNYANSAEADDVEGLTEAINASLELPTPELRNLRSDWIRSRYSWRESATAILESLNLMAKE